MQSAGREKDERVGMCQNNGALRPLEKNSSVERMITWEKTLSVIPKKNTIYRSHPQLSSTSSENNSETRKHLRPWESILLTTKAHGAAA